MEKRKWLWKRKSAEKSPGETESSGSISSHSERYSDEQEALKASPNHNSQSPEVTSKAVVTDEEVNNTVRSLTEKLSAALVNVSAKDDLVKQHSKVAEEAVAGWEKAEIEMVILKQQLEATLQKNLALEDRVAHLDGALKECVRQLRGAREEQEQRIHEAVVEKTRDWEATKLELENQLLELQIQAESTISNSAVSIDPNLHIKLESLEKENSVLKLELLSRSEELEIRNMEMELSTKAAETASKQNLESIKKVARLEAECQRLQAMVRKSSTLNHHKSITSSSICVESLTDSQSDSGERLNSVELDTQKINRLETSECDPNCSDSWASALIAELDQFKNEKAINRSLTACSVEIGMMDDFLEMERLAALPETKSKGHLLEPDAVSNHSANCENPLKSELEAMIHRMADLEEKLKKIEAERAELENALMVSQNSLEASQFQLTEAEMRLEELQRELTLVNESKELLESQLICKEVEARTVSANVDLLKAEVEREQSLSAEMAVKCLELEDKLARRTQDVELQQTASSNSNLKVKQEDLAVAAGKLAECQKTIVSLGRQLQSLATLEDFLIDTESLPVFSDGGSQIPKASEEPWNLNSKDALLPKSDLDPSKMPGETTHPLLNDNNVEPASSLSTSSAVTINHVSSVKIRNGFGKFFSRSRSGVQLESQQR